MNSVSIQYASSKLAEILSAVSKSHIPIEIVDPRHPGVLVSLSDWLAIQETLHLLSIPGMRESIREGLQTSLEECSSSPWSEDVS